MLPSARHDCRQEVLLPRPADLQLRLDEDTVVWALAAEEALREDPRPILYGRDIARLRGQPEGAIREVLETARVWPGARVVS